MEVFSPDNNTGYRYERKYVVRGLPVQVVESIIKMNPAGFSEIFHRRQVNNIYFDTFGLKSYFDRIAGTSNSIKMRIRWYGEFFREIPRSFLEFKIKRGPLGKKYIYELDSFCLDRNFSTVSVRALLQSSKVPEFLKVSFESVEPVILNKFNRKYFLSADTKFRLTIDSEIRYYRMDNFLNMFMDSFSDRDTVVVEIKYSRDDDDSVAAVTNFLPFRISRNSKYINALECLNLW